MRPRGFHWRRSRKGEFAVVNRGDTYALFILENDFGSVDKHLFPKKFSNYFEGRRIPLAVCTDKKYGYRLGDGETMWLENAEDSLHAAHGFVSEMGRAS